MYVKNNIVDVITQYIELEDKGKYLVGKCPFHDDNSPSLIVYPNDGDNGVWRCMSCSEEWGDAISFVQDIEQCSYEEAKKVATEQASASIVYTKYLERARQPDSALDRENLIVLSGMLHKYLQRTGDINKTIELYRTVRDLGEKQLWTQATNLINRTK